MTQQEQMKLVLLYTLSELDGGGQRSYVLDYINSSNYWYKNDQRDIIRASRNESVWRNNFSFERQHLVEHGYMRKNGNGKWLITDDGKAHLEYLIEKTKKLKSSAPVFFTPLFFQKLFAIQSFDEAAEDQQLVEQISQIGSEIIDTRTEILNTPQPEGAISHRSGNQIVYLRDATVAKRALSRSGHLCEIDRTHRSFLRRYGNILYMEPHHLIPMSLTDYFGVNLDREQNIFSLCSNCHNQIHYGTREDVRRLVSKLFLLRECEICSILGKSITLDELFQIYRVL